MHYDLKVSAQISKDPVRDIQLASPELGVVAWDVECDEKSFGPALQKSLSTIQKGSISLQGYMNAPEMIFRNRKEPISFSRLTVSVSDPSFLNKLSPANPIAQSFDLVAVRPQNEKTFQQCCKDGNVDVISLDLSSRLSFPLRFSVLSSAMQRGVHFELCYSHLLLDASKRRNLISNAQSLLRASRGRNILISSDAGKPSLLRTHHDILNLAYLFGLDASKTTDILSCNARSVIVHAYTRKFAYRSVIALSPAETKDQPSNAQSRKRKAEDNPLPTN